MARVMGRTRHAVRDRAHRLRAPWRAGVIALLAALLGSPAMAAEPVPAPRLTIVDGEAVLTEGARRLAATEGVVLRFHTLIETGARSNLLRIEWADGQVVDLGPATRIMFDPPSTRRRGETGPAIYLLQGWVKQQGATGKKSPGMVSPMLDVEPFEGAVVSYVDAERAWLFAEAGQVPLTERGLKSPARLNVRAGGTYTRTGDARGATATRPTSDAMKQVPRAFRDPLPHRFERFKGSQVEAKPLPAPSYADLQAWLSAEWRIRSGFVRRFDELLRDSEFRAGIDANMKDHREWHPILYPPPPPEETPASAPVRR